MSDITLKKKTLIKKANQHGYKYIEESKIVFLLRVPIEFDDGAKRLIFEILWSL